MVEETKKEESSSNLSPKKTVLQIYDEFIKECGDIETLRDLRNNIDTFLTK